VQVYRKKIFTKDAMTKQEIEKIMQMPLSELTEVCKNAETLATLISLAVNIGIRIGQEKAHNHYNRMFRGYNEILISN